MEWPCPLARWGGYGSLYTERIIISLTLCMRPQPESSPYFSNHPPQWKTKKRRPNNAKNLQDHCPIFDMFVSPPILLSILAFFAREQQCPTYCNSDWLQGDLCPSASLPELWRLQWWLFVSAEERYAFPGIRPAYCLRSWHLNNHI